MDIVIGEKGEPMADYEMTLHNPLTDEEWDLITDASLDNTNEITFITKQGKEVKFVKASADVRENVMGEWIHKSEKLAPLNTVWWYECSACGHHAFNGMITDFCPNCGADMRGET